MAASYTLFCEYVHCCGKQELMLGTVEDENWAAQWCLEQTAMKRRPRLPEADLVRTCPVTRCVAKRQVPRYGYRKRLS